MRYLSKSKMGSHANSNSISTSIVEFQINVKDVLKFYDFLRTLGIEVILGGHTTLADKGLEIRSIILKSEGNEIGSFEVLYVDNHYELLKRKSSQLSEEEEQARFLEFATIRWESPVRPILVNIHQRYVDKIKLYRDDFPNEEARRIVSEAKRHLS